MSLISSRQLASDLLGGQLADLVERGALDQPDEPCLGQLVPRAVEAREWAPDRCHRDSRSPGGTARCRRLSRSVLPRSPEDGGMLLAIADARAAGAGGRAPAPHRERAADRGARAGAGARREQPDCVPPFDSSAMDGFAVVAGAAAELRVVGRVPRRAIRRTRRCAPGTAIAISTGAAVPEGADAVVPVERTEQTDGRVRVPGHRAGRQRPPLRRGRARRARSCSAPATGSAPPSWAWPPRSAWRSCDCARRPRVALLVTGDELAEPGRAARRPADLQLERVRAGGAGRARRRRARRDRARGRQPRRHPRGPRRARSMRPTSCASRAACRWARTTT